MLLRHSKYIRFIIINDKFLAGEVDLIYMQLY